ncbi:MAG: hypothetical protein ABMA13_20645 [Chthoniobacteraceae bacterium]
MSEIVLPLHAYLAEQKLIGIEGGEPSLPTLRLADTLLCELRTWRRETADGLVECWPNVRTLRVSIGRVLAAPDSGSVDLIKPAGIAFGPISIETTDDELKAIFNASDIGIECVEVETLTTTAGAIVPGLWLARFDSDDPVDLAAAVNRLRPQSFARWRSYLEGDVRWHELRFIRAPLSWNIEGWERILPPAPVVAEFRAGYITTDASGLAEIRVNEIQSLTLAKGFDGHFVLGFAGRQTSLLGNGSDEDAIATALNAMWPGSTKRFSVTRPASGVAHIEFIGPLSGTDQPLVTATVKDHAPGVLTFKLPLGLAQMCAALRAEASIKVPLEIEMEIVPEDEDPEDPEVAGRLISIQQEVTVARELIWSELAIVPAIEWLRPPTRKSYIPFTPAQVITGQQHYVVVLGDGLLDTFVLDHGLATENISGIIVRENTSNGRVLGPGEVEFVIVDEDSVEITVAFTPAEASLVAIITAAGPKSAFIDDIEITIDQVLGLESAVTNIVNNILTETGDGGGDTTTTTSAAGSPLDQPVLLPDVEFSNPHAHTIKGPAGTVLVPANIVKTDAGAGTTSTYTGSVAETTNRLIYDYAPISPAGEWALDERTIDGTRTLRAGSRIKRATLGNGTYIATAASDKVIVNSDHTLAIGDAIRIQNPTGTLPPELDEETTYYVIADGFSTTEAKLALTAGGSAIDLSLNGSGYADAEVIFPAATVMEIGADADVQLAAEEGLDSRRALPGEFVTFQNGHWFIVRLVGDIWYPSAYDCTIFEAVVSGDLLSSGKRLTLDFAPAFQLASFNGDVNARARLVLDMAVIHDGTPLLDQLDFVERLSVDLFPSAGQVQLRGQIIVDRTDDAPPAMAASATLGGITSTWNPAQVGTFTADAGTDVLAFTAAHRLLAGDQVYVLSTATLPDGLDAGTIYHVIASGLTDTDLKLSETAGGAAVDITDAGTGTHRAFFASVSLAIRARLLDFDAGPAPSSESRALAGSLRLTSKAAQYTISEL